MALEINFKVENLEGREIKDAGYIVVDADKNEFHGYTDVDAEGRCNIKVPDGFSQQNQKLRVTVDDFNGDNYDETGTATDWAVATEIYVDFSVTQDGFYVDCSSRTDSYTPWDMGDGNVVEDRNHTYLYKENGTFVITNDDFSFTVVITNVNVFSVEVNGGEITCTPQSGFVGAWSFGDGSGAVDERVTHRYKDNGNYTVTWGDFSVDIVIDFYVYSLLDSLFINTATLLPDVNGSGPWLYGDGLSGQESIHQYGSHGSHLLAYGASERYVDIPAYPMPDPLFTASKTNESPNVVTFTCEEQGNISWDIDNAFYTGGQVVVTFETAGPKEVILYLTDDAGNVGYKRVTLPILMPNVNPIISNISFEAVLLDLTFTATIVDDDLISSYNWTTSDGQTSEEAVPSFLFETEGIHSITLKVVDARGGEAVTTMEFEVNSSYAYGPELVNDAEFNNAVLDSNWNLVSLSDVELVEHEGRSTCHLTALGGSKIGISYEVTNLEIGEVYLMKGVMKGAAFLKYSGDNSGFGLRVGNDYILIAAVGRVDNDKAQLVENRNGTFQTIEFTFTATESEASIYMYIGRGAGTGLDDLEYEASECWVDSISLKKEL